MILFPKTFKNTELTSIYEVCVGLGATRLIEHCSSAAYDTPIPILEHDAPSRHYILQYRGKHLAVTENAVLRDTSTVYLNPNNSIKQQIEIIQKLKLPFDLARANDVLSRVPLTVLSTHKLETSNLLVVYVQTPTNKAANLSERWLKITAKQKKELLQRSVSNV